jgi:hypothetical protein
MSLSKVGALIFLGAQLVFTANAMATEIKLTNSERNQLEKHFCELSTGSKYFTGCTLPHIYKPSATSIEDRTEIENCLNTIEVKTFAISGEDSNQSRLLNIKYKKDYNKVKEYYANEITCDARITKESSKSAFKIQGFYSGD